MSKREGASVLGYGHGRSFRVQSDNYPFHTVHFGQGRRWAGADEGPFPGERMLSFEDAKHRG